MLGNLLRVLVERYRAGAARRRAAEELYGLDERELADIGISRSEIPYILGQTEPRPRRPAATPAGRLRHA